MIGNMIAQAVKLYNHTEDQKLIAVSPLVNIFQQLVDNRIDYNNPLNNRQLMKAISQAISYYNKQGYFINVYFHNDLDGLMAYHLFCNYIMPPECQYTHAGIPYARNKEFPQPPFHRSDRGGCFYVSLDCDISKEIGDAPFIVIDHHSEHEQRSFYLDKEETILQVKMLSPFFISASKLTSTLACLLTWRELDTVDAFDTGLIAPSLTTKGDNAILYIRKIFADVYRTYYDLRCRYIPDSGITLEPNPPCKKVEKLFMDIYNKQRDANNSPIFFISMNEDYPSLLFGDMKDWTKQYMTHLCTAFQARHSLSANTPFLLVFIDTKAKRFSLRSNVEIKTGGYEHLAELQGIPEPISPQGHPRAKGGSFGDLKSFKEQIKIMWDLIISTAT